MGTNFYLKPRRLHFKQAQESEEIYHIAKRSSGWRPLFQAYMGEPFHVTSVDDIRDLIDHGGWDVVSEYGDVLDPDQFESDVVSWRGGGRSVPLSHTMSMPTAVFHDAEGHELTVIDFR